MSASCLLAALLCFAAPPAPSDIDATVTKAMEQWRVPGLAIAIVRDDAVVHLKGYGVTSLEAKTPVSPDTVFPLASCTKPFTTTLLAMLVDDGKLRWDESVREHVPYFHLKDPAADAAVTLRDLLCHRTGLSEQPMLWYGSPLSLEERVRRLALLEPVAKLRGEFHYQTVAFGAAGLAAENAGGRPWAELLESRVLAPLKMASSSAVEPVGKAMAQPHRRGKDDVIRPIPRYSLKQPDPAGTVHSTARDLTAFLRLHLADGVFDGKRLLSPDRIRELRQPNISIPLELAGPKLNPETTHIGYGLGWIVQDYRGKSMLLHGGAIDGFRAHIALVPEAKLGIAIVSNLDASLCNFALANTLVDLYLEAPPRAWNDELLGLERIEREQDAVRAARLRARQPADAKPLRPLADYQGQYVDDVYGPCEIALDGDHLELRWRAIRAKLDHYNRDAFLSNDPPFRDAPFEFTAANDAIVSVRFLDRTFTRRASVK